MLASSEVEQAKLYQAKDLKDSEELAAQLFGKSYSAIRSSELHELTEELLRNLFMAKKNMPENFVTMLNFVLRHPNIGIVDKNNLLHGLRMFDFELEQLNAVMPLAQMEIYVNEAQAKPRKTAIEEATY